MQTIRVLSGLDDEELLMMEVPERSQDFLQDLKQRIHRKTGVASFCYQLLADKAWGTRKP